MTVRISSKALSLREYLHQLRGLLSKQPVGLAQGDARYRKAWTYRTPIIASGSTNPVLDIPADVLSIRVQLVGASLTGAGSFRVRVGDEDGLKTGGYTAASSGSGGDVGDTTGFILAAGDAAAHFSGTLLLERAHPDTNVWVAKHDLATSAIANAGSGVIVLSKRLTQLDVAVTIGSYDAGTIYVSYA